MSEQRVVVTGDVTTDWNLVTIESSRADSPALKSESAVWNAEDATGARWQAGGAALLGDLAKAVAEPLGFTAHQVGEAVTEVGRVGFRHSYAVWSRFPHTTSSKEGTPQVWRVGKFLGLDQRDQTQGLEAVATWKRDNNHLAEADLVILDDADLGFRNKENKDALWPQALAPASDGPPWVVMKMARPVATGGLFEELVRTCADRLVVVIRINDLRASDVRVSRGLSWEQTAQDLFWELKYNPDVSSLAGCAHVVVSMETDGALLLSSPAAIGDGSEDPQAVLFYDPQTIEGVWAQQYPGWMMGSTSCLAAGVARHLLLALGKPDKPDIKPDDIKAGVQRGMAAMRDLHEKGWGRDPDAHGEDLVFPSHDIATVLGENGEPLLAEEEVPSPPSLGERPRRRWTILEARPKRPLEAVARDIAIRGVERALDGVPLGRFGELVTVDLQEIEGLRSIGALIEEYSRQDETCPLSIAVFGPPGSGKSYGVKQVAGSLLSKKVKELSFNLSQLNDPAGLIGALHQVRDEALRGLLPLVFWDEFDMTLDKQELGWLRHFLVPMQDGTFQQGEITHPIGRAIFVFAGGVYERMEDFRSPKTKQQIDRFAQVKGNDFVSRLKGYVDIVGPNPRDNNREKDPYFPVRRAVLLRQILLRDRPHLFREENGERLLDIDSGVLRGFLETREYRHGVRSLKSIVAMSTLSEKSKFERSSLPAEPQLNLHVYAKDFLRRVQGLVVLEDRPEALADEDQPQLRAEKALLERLAEGAHLVYCEKVLDDGYVWAAPNDDYLLRHALLRPFAEVMGDRRAAPDAKTKTKRALVAYEDLDTDLKEQNRDFARDIPNKLDRVGWIMRPVRRGDPLLEFSDAELEVLAEQEHERWMWDKLNVQWRWGPTDDKEKKENPNLLPWRKLSGEEKKAHYKDHAESVGDDELPDGVKEWDRWLVAAIPKIVAVAGYTVEKYAPEETSP